MKPSFLLPHDGRCTDFIEGGGYGGGFGMPLAGGLLGGALLGGLLF